MHCIVDGDDDDDDDVDDHHSMWLPIFNAINANHSIA